MTEPITRQEAKEQGLKRYFTGVPCSYGHVAERYLSTYKCVGCDQRYNAELAKQLREKRELASNEGMMNRFVREAQAGSDEDRALWRPLNSRQRVYKELFNAMGWA